MARPKYPSDNIDKTMVRFPPGLMDRLKAAAENNHRSMNAEIIARLEASFSAVEKSQDERRMEALIERFESILSGLGYRDNQGNPPKMPRKGVDYE